MGASLDTDRRALLLFATAADAAVVEALLAQSNLACHVCPAVEDLVREIGRGAGVALVAEESLWASDQEILGDVLAAQPEWSDLPLILLAPRQRDAGPLVERLSRSASHHVSLLERPVRSSTLLASVQAALRSRERQYQVRDELVRRRETERALRASEERLRLVADVASFGTYDADLTTGQIHWSLETKRILGIAGDGEGPLDVDLVRRLIHPEDRQRVVDLITSSLDPRGAEVYGGEHRVVTEDGTLRWVMVRGRTLFAGEGEERVAVRTAGTVIDVTERRRAEEILREADRRKDTFLATLAHELRNPLSALRLGLEGIRHGPSAEKIARSHGIMERQLEYLVRLVDDLLDVSRVIQGKMQLQKERVEVAAVVQRALEEVGTLIDESAHQLTVSLPDEAVFVDGDPIRLAQVFANLLSNAAKYTPPGGHIDIGAERCEDGVRVSVRDDGLGIPREGLDAIFEMFGQAHGPLERGYQGLGIGLSLARSMVEKHGGRISAHSAGTGMGSRFDVWLPVAQRDAPAESVAAAAPTAQRSAGPSRRVLVVDDNEDGAQALAMLFELDGHETRSALDGQQAIEVADEFRPHLVLLDIGLPVLNGYDVARRIRRETWGAGTVLVALTGWGQEADRARSREAGFDRHLTKPADPDALLALLDQIDRGATGADSTPAAAARTPIDSA